MGQNVVLTGKRVDDRTLVQEILVDVSGAVISISPEHTKVHQGKLFAVGYGALGVAAAGNIDILFRTPVGFTAHIYIKIACGGDAAFLMYEDVVVSADGTALTIQNHNRTSSNTCGCTAYNTPTITSLGSLVWTEYIPGGSGVSSPGAVQTISTEQVVLAADRDHLFRVTNLSASAETMQITFSFYQIPG